MHTQPSSSSPTDTSHNHTSSQPTSGTKRRRDDDSDGEKSDGELQIEVDDPVDDSVSPAGSSPTYERLHPTPKRERASTPSSTKSSSVSNYWNVTIGT